MTTTITYSAMSSDQTRHTAHWATDPLGGWVVSWLPGRRMGRVLAITAMTLAEVAATRDLSSEHDLWPHVEGWAAELGLTAQQAVDRLAEVA
jgi:hypothetical protein